MKYIKTYENIIIDIIKKEEDVKNEKKNILKLIDDYVVFHTEMWEEWKIDDYFESFDFNIYNYDGEKYLSVEYYEINSNGVIEGEFDFGIKLSDFLEFSENPELYKAAKNYNV